MELVWKIQDDIALGVLDFRRIAEKHHVPIGFVTEAWEMLCEQEREEEFRDYDEYLEDC